MNKTELRKERLINHYSTLERLSEFLGNKQDGKKLSLKLLALEKRGNRAATDYCNGENGMGEAKFEFEKEHLIKEVLKAFGVKEIPGFFINGDPRGYCLKIDDEKVKTFYPESIRFHRDWGGYGILSSEIE
jgi:hypothetical protein